MSGKTKDKSARKELSWKGRLFYGLFLFLLLIATAEITVRFIGFSAWNPAQRQATTDTADPILVPHPRYGFMPNAKEFTVILNDQLSFHTKHTEAGFRISSQPSQKDSIFLPEMWIMGGSFTYGWGIETKQTFPYLMQIARPEYRVYNMGIPAWSPFQNFLLLQDEIKKGNKPEFVVLAYASFHDQRVTCNDFWMKAISTQEVTKAFEYPYSRLPSFGQGKLPIQYEPYLFQKYSAFVHFLEIQKNHSQENKLDSKNSSRILLEQMASFCSKNDVKFVLAGLEPDQDTKNMLESQKENAWKVCDISVDRTKPGMSLEPLDPHPSAAAHRIYSENLLKCLFNK